MRPFVHIDRVGRERKKKPRARGETSEKKQSQIKIERQLNLESTEREKSSVVVTTCLQFTSRDSRTDDT